MNIVDKIFQFLDQYCDKKMPFLIGLSGGADSKALLSIVLEYQKKHRIFFGVAHIDHGWREESAVEALQLSQLALELKIPFHLKTLNPQTMVGNLEEACRLKRFAFFKELCDEYGYQAVLLGHHADDQSETVLKRVLEGSSLIYLSGMKSIGDYQGLNIWRPLMDSSKVEILEWIHTQGIHYFEDRTNFNEKYLRARFRSKIIPQLSKDFGKSVSKNLYRLGQEAQELRDYLDTQLKPFESQIVSGPFGSFLDLSHGSFHAFEIKYLIRKVCENVNIRFSRPIIEEACEKIRLKKPNGQLVTKHGLIYFDRGYLFVMRRLLNEFSDEIFLKPGHHFLPRWEVNISEESRGSHTTSSWREAWQGLLQVSVPPGNYSLKRGDASLSKWWTNAKIPAFMRYAFPVLFNEKEIVHEFLTGRKQGPLLKADQNHWLITLRPRF